MAVRHPNLSPASTGTLYWVRRLTDFARQDDPPEDTDELVIPEDLAQLSDADLNGLHDRAVDAFNDLFGDGDVSAEDLDRLRTLKDGIFDLRTERDRRAAEQAERTEQATAIAAEINPVEEHAGEDCEDCDQADDGDGDGVVDAQIIEVSPDQVETEPVAASAGRREIRVNLPSVRSRQSHNPRPAGEQISAMRDIVMAAPDVPGFSNGQGMDYADLGRAVDRRLTSFNVNQYVQAARRGEHLHQQFGVATIQKPFPPELMVQSDDGAHVDEVLQRAMSEHRLPGGSLVAAGGWCAPSETVYDLCELESRDGLVSVPEIGLSRGGIRWTKGPDFSSIFNSTGFCYTEAEAIAGDWDGQGGGAKPCFTVECPDFEEERMGLCGTCITAGLLQARGYPEVIARTIRGALTAHEHRVSSAVIQAVVTGSTAVAFPAGQAGATAPILTAIELQVEAIRYKHRMGRATTMEAIFPYWVRGAIRADLSRRLGVDLLAVTDAQINQWFASRGISPQFVYNWQDLTTEPVVAYPAQVSFLLYPAGTWVKGTSDIITLETIYDSVQLGQNEYTALFTEEGFLVAQLCHDSRNVTVPICPDGATAAGVAIECNGAEAVATP